MAKNLQANLVNDKTIAILKKFMIFDDLVSADIKKILSLDVNTTDAYQNRIVKLCQYKAGEVVIREGEFDQAGGRCGMASLTLTGGSGRNAAGGQG